MKGLGLLLSMCSVREDALGFFVPLFLFPSPAVSSSMLGLRMNVVVCLFRVFILPVVPCTVCIELALLLLSDLFGI